MAAAPVPVQSLPPCHESWRAFKRHHDVEGKAWQQFVARHPQSHDAWNQFALANPSNPWKRYKSFLAQHPELAQAWGAFHDRFHAETWKQFVKMHPCVTDPSQPAPALGAYASAPLLAWSGWRLRIPGGPEGGQYHGFIAPDDTKDGMGWPAGHDETYRTIDSKAGLGAYPWQAWDSAWGGIPLKEGQTLTDYVYRGPAEMRPRPNASGGVNTVRALQTKRSAGYAVAPGNYKGLGAVPANVVMRVPYNFEGGPMPCPAWGCEGPPRPIRIPWVLQPPPTIYPQPSPVTSGSLCPPGQSQDAAGNCVTDERNPYVLYLPQSPAPAPTVSATPTDSSTTVAPASSTDAIMAWLEGSTLISGVPNWGIAAVGGVLLMKVLKGRR